MTNLQNFIPGKLYRIFSNDRITPRLEKVLFTPDNPSEGYGNGFWINDGNIVMLIEMDSTNSDTACNLAKVLYTDPKGTYVGYIFIHYTLFVETSHV